MFQTNQNSSPEPSRTCSQGRNGDLFLRSCEFTPRFFKQIFVVFLYQSVIDDLALTDLQKVVASLEQHLASSPAPVTSPSAIAASTKNSSKAKATKSTTSKTTKVSKKKAKAVTTPASEGEDEASDAKDIEVLATPEPLRKKAQKISPALISHETIVEISPMKQKISPVKQKFATPIQVRPFFFTELKYWLDFAKIVVWNIPARCCNKPIR
jgi:hypothetical protein